MSRQDSGQYAVWHCFRPSTSCLRTRWKIAGRGVMTRTYRRVLVASACLLTVAMLSGCGTSAQDVSTAHVSASRPTSATPPMESRLVEPRASQSGDWFEDETARSGIEFIYETGRSAKQYTILETVGGGVGFFDFDLDFRLDLYAVGGGDVDETTATPRGIPGRLFRQESDGEFGDVTTAARLPASTDYSHGIIAGDLDNDGFPDVLLTCYGECQLWWNLGDGTFESAAEIAGLATPGWHTAAACVDLSGDGILDLFVVDYVNWTPSTDNRTSEQATPHDVPPPDEFGPSPDHLFVSLGDGRFTEASAQAGIRTDGMGLGVLAADFNDDGAADVYVANDVVGNHLYWGGTDFPLQETAERSGVAFNETGNPEGSMGVDAEDVNGDGLPDLWVTNFELEDNSLYLNLGGGLFQHSTVRMGLSGLGRTLVGFGTGIQDFDGDGWPDLYVLNGHVQYHSPGSPFRQPAMLFRNDAGRRFKDLTPRGGPWFSFPHSARGGAVGDWNNDGAVDLAISSLDEPLAMLRNRQTAARCLRLRLVGTNSPRDPIGATITFERQGHPITRLMKSGSGYLSQSDSRLIIPLEVTSEFVDISVRWPSTLHESFRVPAVPGDHVLVENCGTAKD
ncbi:hypothetical protein GC176_25500 [bacterium]|nr:hypothetical protein [bacterium]